MPKAVWGVDVSKFSVKAARLQPVGEGSATITALDVIEYPVGQEGSDEDTLIKDALVTLMKRQRLRGETVVVSLPGHTTFNRFIKIPPTEPKKVEQLVKFEAQQHIPFPMDQVVWGYQIVEKEYGPGDEIELVLFAVKKDIIYHFLSLLQAVDFPCDILQFSPVALYNFLVHDQDVGTNCFILDMGAENSDLIVIDGEKFWIRNIPITGNTITKALQQKFQIPPVEAEKLKVNASSSPQAQKIFGVVQPVLRDLVGEIHRSIGYYKSLSKTVRFEKMMIVGNASKTINFQRFLSQNLQIEAMKLAKMNKFNASSSVSEETFQNYLPTLGVVCGLGLQGMGIARNKINLLPPEELEKKAFAKKKPIYAAAVGILLLTVGLMYWRAGEGVTQWTDAEKQAQDVIDRYNRVKGQYEGAKNQAGKNEVIPAKLGTLSQRRDASVVLMNAISEVLPNNEAKEVKDKKEQIWVMRIDAEDAQTTKAAEGGVMGEDQEMRVTIEGGMPEQASLQEALKRLEDAFVNPALAKIRDTYRISTGEVLTEITDIGGKPSGILAPPPATGTVSPHKPADFGGVMKFHNFRVKMTLYPSKPPPAPPADPNAGGGGPGGGN
jgi:type IV pilus assembly protein PilM